MSTDDCSQNGEVKASVEKEAELKESGDDWRSDPIEVACAVLEGTPLEHRDDDSVRALRDAIKAGIRDIPTLAVAMETADCSPGQLDFYVEEAGEYAGSHVEAMIEEGGAVTAAHIGHCYLEGRAIYTCQAKQRLSALARAGLEPWRSWHSSR